MLLRSLAAAVALTAASACGPPADWKCADNAGLNCTCQSPPRSGDTAVSCASYTCCIHYEQNGALGCACKVAGDSTCASEINTRSAGGATNVQRVSQCPG